MIQVMVGAMLFLLLVACGGGNGGSGGDGSNTGGGGTGGGNEVDPRTDFYGIDVVDFDSDGLNDLVAASVSSESSSSYKGNINVFRQQPLNPGSFESPKNFLYGMNLTTYAIVASDIQLDFLPDVVTAVASEGGFRVMLQDAGNPGSLLPSRRFGTFSAACCGKNLAVGDIDLDGLPDVALVDDGRLVYHLQNAANPGTFLGQRLVGVGSGTLAIADMNGDDLPDLVTFNSHPDDDKAPDTVSYHRHDPVVIGQFLQPLELSIDIAGIDLGITDVDADGRMDIVVAGFDVDPDDFSSEGKWTVLRQSSPNNFDAGPIYQSQAGLLTNSIDIADMDGDGHMDVVVGNLNTARDPNNIQVFFQNSGTFSSSVTIGLPNDLDVSRSWIYAVRTADLNGDGLVDIAVSTGEVFVVFQRPSGGGSFGTPIRLAGHH